MSNSDLNPQVNITVDAQQFIREQVEEILARVDYAYTGNYGDMNEDHAHSSLQVIKGRAAAVKSFLDAITVEVQE